MQVQSTQVHPGLRWGFEFGCAASPSMFKASVRRKVEEETLHPATLMSALEKNNTACSGVIEVILLAPLAHSSDLSNGFCGPSAI